MGKQGDLRSEMLDAFLAIGPMQDEHVRAYRIHAHGADRGHRAAVLAHRSMSGATGVPESVTPPRPAPQTAMLPDPHLTDAEYFAKRRAKTDPNAGKAEVRISMLEWIGGLARLSDATEPQQQAAARYRTIHERAQLGGARAIDYGLAKVDTSGPSETAVMEIGAAAREAYSDAVQMLGMLRSNLVEKVVIYDIPISGMVKGGRARERLKRELFDALDDLAVHFRLASRKAA